jgi:hypothetical protein
LEVKDYFIFLVFGKVAIFFLQTFPPLKKIKWKFLQEMLECDLCTGFWAYTALCFTFNVNLVPEFPIVSQVLTGAFSSLLMHIISIGWKEKWSVINISVNREE